MLTVKQELVESNSSNGLNMPKLIADAGDSTNTNTNMTNYRNFTSLQNDNMYFPAETSSNRSSRATAALMKNFSHGSKLMEPFPTVSSATNNVDNSNFIGCNSGEFENENDSAANVSDDSTAISNPKQKSNFSGKNSITNSKLAKCIWCEAPRSRNDLCNRCRQKVESRARRLLEQKILQDIKVVDEILAFISTSFDLSQISTKDYNCIFADIFPFLVGLLCCCFVCAFWFFVLIFALLC